MDRTQIVIIGVLILLFVACTSLIAKLKKPRIEAVKAPKQPSLVVVARKRARLSDPDYLEKLKENAIASFLETKERALSIGSTHYIWRSCDDGSVCIVCSTNHGRKFRWDHPHHHGHPGYGCRAHDGHCRCYAEPVIPN